jgi:DNA gyrase subunit A
LIADENVVITISHAGYIKRTNLTEYKTQNRGGVGQKRRTKRPRFLRAYVCCDKPSIYDVLYPKGKCFWMRVYEIPEGSKTAKVERFKILLISRAMIRSKHLFYTKNNKIWVTKIRPRTTRKSQLRKRP